MTHQKQKKAFQGKKSSPHLDCFSRKRKNFDPRCVVSQARCKGIESLNDPSYGIITPKEKSEKAQ